MGRLEGEKSSRMMKFLLLSLIGFLGVQGQGGSQMKEIMEGLNVYNARTKCWGETNINNYILGMIAAQEKCMQLAPAYDLISALNPQENPFATLPGSISSPFKKLQDFQNLDQLNSLWRTKRQASAGLLQPDQDDFAQFLADFEEYKENIASKMGNLTCVLIELKQLTADLKINIDFYTTPLTEVEGFEVEESAAKDPEWANKLIEGYKDCYKISENWPQASLNRNPLTKVFGRHMVFFRCADKNEKRMCAKAQLLKWFETLYGTEDSDESLADYGLPEDKYDAGLVSWKVLRNAATPEEKFVSDFLWSTGN